jgi:hypothetical protein
MPGGERLRQAKIKDLILQLFDLSVSVQNLALHFYLFTNFAYELSWSNYFTSLKFFKRKVLLIAGDNKINLCF